MRKTILASALFAVMFVGCQQEKKETLKTGSEEVSVEEVKTKKTIPAYTKTFKTNNYSIVFEADKGEVSTVKIKTTGLGEDKVDSLKVEGEILAAHMTDLNNDGFKEFFLTVSPTDDSGNIDLIGIASNKGKSFSDIMIQELDLLRDKNTDKVTIGEDRILREFFTKGQAANCTYKLTEGEAGYILSAVKQ